MDDLIAFLTARLDEYEAAAYGLAGTTWTAKRLGDHDYEIRVAHDPLVHATAPTGGIADVQREDVAEWIATHHPRRVLREVEAKRAIVGTGASLAANHDTPIRIIGETMLMDIASIWSDHPDYRQEWALGD